MRGDVDKDGVPHAEPWQGLWDNLDTLRTNVFEPITTGDGVRPVTLTAPNGTTTQTADCQFEPLRPQGEIDDPNAAIYTFRLTVPAGRFA